MTTFVFIVIIFIIINIIFSIIIIILSKTLMQPVKIKISFGYTSKRPRKYVQMS